MSPQPHLESQNVPQSTKRVITFRVEGEPKAQPRPKAFARNFGGGKWQARVYDPGTAENWKSLIAFAAKPHLPAEPLTGPVSVLLLFSMPRPKAHFKASGELKPNAPTLHIGRPDSDNLAKAVCDALTQCGAWRDDGQIARLAVNKSYANAKPGLTVLIVDETQ